jgi:hypothetical protein
VAEQSGYAPSKNKLQPPDFEWVAHSMIIRAIFIFLG